MSNSFSNDRLAITHLLPITDVTKEIVLSDKNERITFLNIEGYIPNGCLSDEISSSVDYEVGLVKVDIFSETREGRFCLSYIRTFNKRIVLEGKSNFKTLKVLINEESDFEKYFEIKMNL